MHAWCNRMVSVILYRFWQEAVDMSVKLLDASTRKPLLEIVEEEMLQPFLSLLIERGLKVS
jgi:hypothetical protein